MKKFIAIVLMVCLVLSVGALAVGCNKTNADYTVGILQLVTHPALDQATQGFKDALTEAMTAAGKTVAFDYQNAANDSAICNTVAINFKSKNVDLILANATPALQACANATTAIPILGTSITEYGVALGLNNFNGTVGGNISGTSDLADLDSQAKMIIDLFPDAKTVGLLYCSGEPNSNYQVKKVGAYLTAKGLTAKEYAFTDSNDMPSVARQMIAEVDVVYVPTDNTVANNAESLDGICRPAGVPVVAGEEGICATCGVATLSISYYGIGKKTGQMAAEILLKGADISTMAIASDENPVYKYNKEICDELGITIPSNYEKIVKA